MTISTEIICAAISACGVLVSAAVSRSVSRYTANKEIEKMKLAWERDDIVSSEEEFAEMASSVAKHVCTMSGKTETEALAKVAAIRSKENGELAHLLDNLYSSISSKNGIDGALTRVIEEKRKARACAKKQHADRPDTYVS